jgi:hypothetical protein
MSPTRRDGEGHRQAGPTWESLIDRQIREAMEAGAFEDLPYRGEPIPIDDDGTDMALAHHVLRQSGFVPGWIGTDAEIRDLLAERDRMVALAHRAGPPVRDRQRAALRDLVERVNRLVMRLEHEAPTPRQHRRRLDPVAELAALEAAAEGG